MGLTTISIVIVVYGVFLINWGANYRRLPIEVRLGLDTTHEQTPPVIPLRDALRQFIDENRPDPEDRDVGRAIQSVSRSMTALIHEWEGKPVVLPDRVKTVPGGLLIRMSVLGVCSPFFVEPHVDGMLPPMPFIRVASHELAHVAGNCGEAEADFVGWVAGLRADDPYMRYATAIHLYLSLLAGLPPDEQERAFHALPPDAVAEWTEYRNRLMQYQNPLLVGVSRQTYHTYLQTQGVRGGIADYSRSASLFLAAWSQDAIEVPIGKPEHIARSTTK